MNTEDDYILACAIDFGTSFSSYAFSFKTDPDNVVMNRNWSGGLGYQSYKTPTSVLMDASGKFVDFGYRAEERYAQIEQSGDTENKSLFKNFKMTLHNKKTINAQTTVTATNGTIKPAIDICAYSLQFLKDHLLERVEAATSSKPQLNLIRWVLTVPAIWRDEAKQFMREAAKRAGLIDEATSRSLIIALEPEAASLYCRELAPANFVCPSQDKAGFPVGTRYVVVDVGGGTTDITVHEVVERGVREVHFASGGACGGTDVNANFEGLMDDLLTAAFMRRFKAECPEQWFGLINLFERNKKMVDTSSKGALTITFPYGLDRKFSDITKNKLAAQLKKTTEDTDIEFLPEVGALRFKWKAVRKLFSPVVSRIVEEIQTVVKKVGVANLTYLLLVGGFAESSIMRDEVNKEFGDDLVVLVPQDAQLAIIKGAVKFGHCPNTVLTRIAKVTYGIQATYDFEEGVHRENTAVYYDGTKKSQNVFMPLIQKGDEIKTGDFIENAFFPIYSSQSAITVQFYTYPRKLDELAYITDPGFTQIGKGVTVKIPKVNKGARVVNLKLFFGETEIKIVAKNDDMKESKESYLEFV